MKTSQIVAITAGTFLAAGVGYALYFDHKRQTDPAFRKQLSKDAKRKKKADKKQQQAEKKEVQDAINTVVREARQPGKLPSDPQSMEKYFMKSLEEGETLLALGPAKYIESASAFFRAMKVYPDPMGLLGVLRQATPEPVLEMVIAMIAKDYELGEGSGPSNPAAAAAAAASAGAGRPDPMAQLAELAAQAPNANDQTSPPSASGPPSQASSQEWDTLSGDSLGTSGSAAESNVTATGAAAAESNNTAAGSAPSNIEVPSQNGSAAFDFSSSGSFAPSPLFNQSNPLAGAEAAAAGAADVETPDTKAEVDDAAKEQSHVQSESGV